MWSFVDPLLPTLDSHSDPTRLLITCSSNSNRFQSGLSWTLIGANLILALVVWLLGVKTGCKHVEAAYKESKSIKYAVFNVFLVAVIIIPMEFFGDALSAELKFLFLIAGILIISDFSLLVLFVPKFLALYQVQNGTNTGPDSGDKNHSRECHSQSHSHGTHNEPSNLELALKELTC